MDEVFAIIGDNIQVDGTELSDLPVNQPDEQVDCQLEGQLETLQVETDQLLVEIAELRRTCPEALQQRFALDMADLERLMPGIGETLSPITDIKDGPHLDVAEETTDRLVVTLARLRDMNESIPELAAKLKRAQMVFKDTNASNGTGGSSRKNFQELNSMMHKQRRILRQHDLATKLLQQQ